MQTLPLDIRIFEWFDHHAWGYWLLAWSAFTLVLASALAPATTSGGAAPASDSRPLLQRLLGSNLAFATAVLLVFCAFRWPLWFAGQLDNPDEAQWIAGALTLRDGGLPWKSLDCHTSGPLNPYTLLLTLPLGLPLDYVGARVLTSLLQAGAALALWGAARRFVPEWAARLAVFVPVNLWACRWFHDIGQYSSETAPVFLHALAGWAAAGALTTPHPRRARGLLAAAGALTTLPFFAKPQSALLAAALGALLLGAVWFAAPPAGAAVPSRRERGLRTALLALGAAVPFLLCGGYLWLYGLINQVRVFFWKSNLLYAGAREFPLCDSPEVFFDLIDPIRGSAMAVLGALAFGLLATVPAFTAERGCRGRLLGAWLLVAVAFLTVFSPGRMFRHYVHFLVVPLGWLAALALAGGWRHLVANTTPAAPRRWLAGLVGIFLLLTTAWPAWQTANTCRPMNGQLYFWRERQISTVGAHLRRLVAPGDKLVVWGWTPKYHTETGLGQGAREAHGAFIIGAGPLQSHYRDRLLFDLRRNRPRWFVDSVAPRQFGFQDRSLFGHDAWPELRDYIAAHYEQVDEVDAVRIYRRKD